MNDGLAIRVPCGSTAASVFDMMVPGGQITEFLSTSLSVIEVLDKISVVLVEPTTAAIYNTVSTVLKVAMGTLIEAGFDESNALY